MSREQKGRELAKPDDEMVREQIAYYESRAAEYDDWWERRNAYDAGPEFVAAWRHDIAQLRTWLEEVRPRGHVLEIAAGTGTWTKELLNYADHVTALDASEAMLSRCQKRLCSDNVDFVVADVLTWDPPQQYDCVFFAFWASLVPPLSWEHFWTIVGRALAAGGTVLFIDSVAPPTPDARSGPSEPHVRSENDPTFLRRRRLSDGSEYSVVKRYWLAAELEASLASQGWCARVRETAFAFIYGEAQQASPPVLDC